MIIHSGDGTGNATITMSQYGNTLNMINDGATSLTVTVGSIPIVVKMLEQFNGDFALFNSFTIAATGNWRFVVEYVADSEEEVSTNTIIPEILRRVRERITDLDVVEFTNTELVGYVNDAIDWLGLQRIQAGDPEMVEELTVSEGDKLPFYYHSLCGIFPVVITGSVFSIMGSTTAVIRYFATKPHVHYVAASNYYSPLHSPFKPAYDTLLIQRTAILALNRNADDISQDEKLLAQQAAGGVQHA